MQSSSQTPFRASALKYRPQALSEVIGQEVLVKTLENSIKNKRIAHAYIFTGMRGVGKTSTARLLARGLNCQGPDGTGQETPTPCGKCGPCQDIFFDRSLDVLEIDAASQTGVDDIRKLIENVSYKPVQGRYKIYIIDEVHMLSKSAFNALLKTLEEPPQHVKFFFATTEIDKVPVTILSRCQRFDLQRVPAALLMAYLTHILHQEQLTGQEAALAHIVEASEGSVRDALSLLDQAINMGEGAVTTERVEAMLGYARSQDVTNLLNALFQGKCQESLAIFRALYQSGISCLALCNRLLSHLHRLTVAVMLDDETGIDATEKTLKQTLTVPTLTRAWQLIIKSLEEIKKSPQEATAMEMLLIRFCYLHPLPNFIDLVGPSHPVASPSLVKSALFDTETSKMSDDEIKKPSSKTIAPHTSTPPASIIAAEKSEISDATECPEDCFDEKVIEFFETLKEPLIASHLVQSVVILACSKGNIVYKPVKPLPDGFALQVQKHLKGWMGTTWQVKETQDGQGITLAEKRAEIEKKSRQAYEKSGTFSAAKQVFTDLKVKELKNKGAFDDERI